MTSPQQRPPPPIPRRHPSRPSVGASSSSTSSSPSRLDADSPTSFNTFAQLLHTSNSDNTPTPTTASFHYDSPGQYPLPSVKVSLERDPPPLLQSDESSLSDTELPYASNGDYFDQQATLYRAGHSAALSPMSGSDAAGPRPGPSPGPGHSGSPNAPPLSPGIQSRLTSGGIGLGTVGLGPVRIDFKDWVKAGREAREGSVSTTGDDDEPPAPVESHASSSSSRVPKRFSLGSRLADPSNVAASNNRSVSLSQAAIGRVHESSTRPTQLESSITSSTSMSSISVDSHHSPEGLYARRASSRVSDRGVLTSEALRTTSTPRRQSSDLVREFQSFGINGGSSRSSQRMSIPHSPSSPAPTSPPTRAPPHSSVASPLEHRLSRTRMLPRQESSSALVDRVDEEDGDMETMVSLERHDPDRRPRNLEDRLREADDRVPSRASQRFAEATGNTTPQRSTRVESFRRQHTDSRLSPPNGMSTPGPPPDAQSPSSAKHGSSGGRMGKQRQPIPLEFQNGRLFTPPPKAVPDNISSTIDLNQSPGGAPGSARERSRDRESDYNLASPRSQRSYATARPYSVLDNRTLDRTSRESPLRAWAGRSSNVGGTHGRSNSRNEVDQYAQRPGSARREFPTSARNRPESVLETMADRDRYENGPYTPSRMRFSNDSERSARLSALINDRNDSPYRGSGDFSSRLRDLGANDGSVRTPLTPNDSVSAVGSRTDVGGGSTRKDPMDIIRRLEETRAQSNRKWEEDRSMSALGDRSPSTMGGERSRYGDREVLAGRPASRVDDAHTRASSRMSTASRMRSSTSLASVSTNRESYMYAGTGTPRTQPMTRRRTTSTDDAASVESPLVGRSSRQSGSFAGSLEPRVVRRSQTSFGERSASSNASDVLATTEHGRNLVDAAKTLDRKLELDPEVMQRLTIAASTGERANTGIRAAAAIAAQLAIDVELDDKAALTTVRERLPRLAVTLREAGRSSDQAVRDLTDALLAMRGQVSTPIRGTTPRRPDTHYVPREPTSEPQQSRPRWSTAGPADTPLARHTQLQSPLANSPSARLGSGVGRETPRLDRERERERERGERERERLPVRERKDSGASSSSRNEPSTGTSSRFDGPRSLDPIEQSPPPPGSHRTSPVSSGRANALRLASPPARTERSASRSQPPQPHNSPAQGPIDQHQQQQQPQEPGQALRKQSSIASTHTVRPYSFAPSHPPEPTTALSNSPAYSQPAALPHEAGVTAAAAAAAAHQSPTHARRPSGAGHAKRDSAASNSSSVYSRASMDGNGNGHGNANAAGNGHAAGNLAVAGNGSAANGDQLSPTAAVGPVEVQRMGTFGAADGARVRASVSERFRKHLAGE